MIGVGLIGVGLIGVESGATIVDGSYPSGGTIQVIGGTPTSSFEAFADHPTGGTIQVRGGLPIIVGNLAPIRFLPGWAFNGASVSFPITSLVGVLSASADEATGDSRDIVQGLLLRAVEYLTSLPPEDVRNAVLALKEDPIYPHPILGTVLRRTITAQFGVVYSSAYPADEP